MDRSERRRASALLPHVRRPVSPRVRCRSRARVEHSGRGACGGQRGARAARAVESGPEPAPTRLTTMSRPSVHSSGDQISRVDSALPTALRLACRAPAASATVCSGGAQISSHPATRRIIGGSPQERAKWRPTWSAISSSASSGSASGGAVSSPRGCPYHSFAINGAPGQLLTVHHAEPDTPSAQALAPAGPTPPSKL